MDEFCVQRHASPDPRAEHRITRAYVLFQMMNSALKMMNCALKMMNVLLTRYVLGHNPAALPPLR